MIIRETYHQQLLQERNFFLIEKLFSPVLILRWHVTFFCSLSHFISDVDRDGTTLIIPLKKMVLKQKLWNQKSMFSNFLSILVFFFCISNVIIFSYDEYKNLFLSTDERGRHARTKIIIMCLVWVNMFNQRAYVTFTKNYAQKFCCHHHATIVMEKSSRLHHYSYLLSENF